MEVRNKRSNQISRDFISDLPDELLCHVLSFLTTKQAALTPILSKRWSNLLPWVPVLDFDDSLLLKPLKGQRQNRVFKEFVDRSLSLRVGNSSSLERFTLKCHRGGARNQDRINKWIQRVTSLLVFEISLHLDFRKCQLPLTVFTSKTLVKLRIGSRLHLLMSSSCSETETIILSSTLNDLVLDSVAFKDCNVGFKPILSAFPLLQKLRIHESKKWTYWNGSITSQTLKKLLYRIDLDCYLPKRCVSFDTPSLEYLNYSDVVAEKYENLHLDSLVEAKLDLRLTANQIMRKKAQDDDAFVPGDVTSLFMGIRNVRILDLSPDALDTLYYRGETIPVFKNLISLSLGSDEPHGTPFIFWKLLPSLLLNSVKLETLIIKGLGHYVKQGWEAGVGHLRISWDEVSNSLSSSAVKVLKITAYKGTCEELNQMKRFLMKLSCLEMVKVVHRAVEYQEKWCLLRDLLVLPKASSKCEICVV